MLGCYFMLGGYIRKYSGRIKEYCGRSSTIIGAMTAIVAGMSVTYLVGKFYSSLFFDAWDFVWYGYDLLPVLVNTVALYVLAVRFGANNKIITIVGSNTLGIFFIHNIIIRLTHRYVILLPLFCTFIGNLIYASMVVVVCTLISLILKKVPLFSLMLR